jgi:hypothetical protein
MGREQDHDTGAGRAPAPADPERQAPPAEPQPRDTRHPETDRHPAPHIVHEPEPDAGNIMPAKDEPGTL